MICIGVCQVFFVEKNFQNNNAFLFSSPVLEIGEEFFIVIKNGLNYLSLPLNQKYNLNLLHGTSYLEVPQAYYPYTIGKEKLKMVKFLDIGINEINKDFIFDKCIFFGDRNSFREKSEGWGNDYDRQSLQ